MKNAKLVEEVTNRLLEQIQRLNKGSFMISVIVSDPKAVIGLDSAIENYLKSTPFIKKRIEANEIRNKARLAKIEEELPKLDSLRSLLTEHVKCVQIVSKTDEDMIHIIQTNDQRLHNALMNI